MTHIPSIYRIYFATIDPLLAISGAILILINPIQFLAGCAPLSSFSPTSSPPSTEPLSPLTTFLLNQTAALYLCLSLICSLVLRAASSGVSSVSGEGAKQELKIWRTTMLAVFFADLGHIGSVYVADPETFTHVLGWRGEDWINFGLLITGAVLRAAFLLGIGVSSKAGGGRGKKSGKRA